MPMPVKDIGIVVEGKGLPDGGLELAFLSLRMGFTSSLCNIRKESGETVEDAGFLHEPPVRTPWMFRFIYGLGELKPVLRVADRKGNAVWFYHGWDRKRRERIYFWFRSMAKDSDNRGGDMLIDRESFALMVTRLRQMTGQAA